MGIEDVVVPIAEVAVVSGLLAVAGYALHRRLYVPIPPNTALVLFGGGRGGTPDGERTGPGSGDVRRPRILVGGSAFIPPWSRGIGQLSLKPRVVDVTVRSMHSLDGDRAGGWEARLHVQAKIPADPELLAVAAENLLGRGEGDITELIRHIVAGAVPAVLARIPREADEPDWERLASEVQASVATELISVGLVVRALSITELLRISPGDGRGTMAVARAAPVPAPPSAASLETTSNWITALDLRLVRLERSLGILETELSRATPVLPLRGAAGPSRPYGLPGPIEAPRAAVLPYPGESFHRDPSGGDPSPRAGPRPNDDAAGKGVRPARSPLDPETKR